ncbi:MAG: V-type ATP synthase subunit D [Pirellulaceae bacterium]|nr:V-type ATP synthase subunit D [Pirellulaceae bacterium]
MAKKVKLTRPELKRYRDALARYERFLPMLKLKQQQLQLTLREVAQRCRAARQARDDVAASIGRYRSVLGDRAGLDLEASARPSEVRTSTMNIAGVELPVFEDVVFPPIRYSLFGTPPWVDQVLQDLRERSRREAMLAVLLEEERLLQNELARIIQRVNLFEKIMVPQARDAIRRIRIKLGDEMTSAVGRGKIAKNKIGDARTEDPADLRGDVSAPEAELTEPGAAEEPEGDLP